MAGNLNVYAKHVRTFVRVIEKKLKRATNVKLYRNPFKSSFKR